VPVHINTGKAYVKAAIERGREMIKVWHEKKVTGFEVKKDILGLKAGCKFVALKDVAGYNELEKHITATPRGMAYFYCLDMPRLSYLFEASILKENAEYFERKVFPIFLCNVFEWDTKYRRWRGDKPVKSNNKKNPVSGDRR